MTSWPLSMLQETCGRHEPVALHHELNPESLESWWSKAHYSLVVIMILYAKKHCEFEGFDSLMSVLCKWPLYLQSWSAKAFKLNIIGVIMKCCFSNTKSPLHAISSRGVPTGRTLQITDNKENAVKLGRLPSRRPPGLKRSLGA